MRDDEEDEIGADIETGRERLLAQNQELFIPNERQQADNTVQSLMAHLCCFTPMISACYYTYFTPPEHEAIDRNTAECQDEYRLYLLVSGSCLIVPTLLIAYIVLCNKWHSVDRV